MSKKSRGKTLFVWAILLAVIGSGTGYYYKAEAKDVAAVMVEEPQAMPVFVKIVQLQPVQIWKNFSARLEAVDFAEIRPQISGIVQDVKFQEGQIVEKGDVLYVIDPRPYKAAVDKAKAELNVIYNEITLAEKELERAKNLIEADAISERIYDERSSALDILQARAGSARAQLDQAKINLDYAYVKAPISGKVSRVEVKVGNLVEAGPNAPLLTSIVSTDGIYADFEIDEQTYIKQVRTKSSSDSANIKIPVKLRLKSSDKTYEGYVYSFDNRIDVSSGTIRARALFPNEDGALLPGMFASIDMGSADISDKILISEKAIGTDQNRKFVYVVDDNNKIAYRTIKLGDSTDGQRIVLSGLNVGDRVVVEGVIRIQPDMKVDPQIQAAAQDSEVSQ